MYTNYISPSGPVMRKKPFRTLSIRFNRHEWAGSFGDIGTDLPLLVGIVLATGMNATRIFIIFGIIQVIIGFYYHLPMPMQPLKAVAVIIITQHVPEGVIYGGGIMIGLIMFLLALTGLVDKLAQFIPQCVVRGIQLGLGLSLAKLAINSYIPTLGPTGYLLAFSGLVTVLGLWGSDRLPPGLFVIFMGVVYALFRQEPVAIPPLELHFAFPKAIDMWTGLILLAIPQLPLSLSNSVIATKQTIDDLFPKARVSFRRIGFTYSVANFASSLLGGVPLCHGCGGLAGHYALGARTGGSVIIYGSLYIAAGLIGGVLFAKVIYNFPLPLLGVILLCEAAALCSLVHDQFSDTLALSITLIVGGMVVCLPYGYLIGLCLGTILFRFAKMLVLPRKGVEKANE